MTAEAGATEPVSGEVRKSGPSGQQESGHGGGKTLVQITNLKTYYPIRAGILRRVVGNVRAVDDVTFEIRRGEVFGLVGESGCGKSTLAYQLLGYRHPNARVRAGRVLFGDRDLLTLGRAGLEALRGDRISFVAQNPTTALSPGMRVGRQVAELLARHGKAQGRAAVAARVDALFQQVGLPASEALGRRYPHELSGGQQQRVVIAMALACDPDLVVLDEPTTGLDVTTQRQIIDLLQDLRQRFRMSMVYVTHDLLLL